MSKRAAREAIFKTLFQTEFIREKPDVLIAKNQELTAKLTAAEKEYYIKTITGVDRFKDKIDALIAGHLKNWELKRLAIVDKTILRLALYEMLCLDDIPVAVSINEAVDLAKKYGEEKSAAFINGVLDSIYKSGQLL
ncbi:MAG TPA: transcription antitermination factor NusB [Firmicutes bacterium]|nr:transcription antitermination factor NusB [Bacillota bacterium]